MLDKIVALQNKAVSNLESLLSSGKKKVITFKAPTGSGKTFIIAKLMDSMLSKNGKLVFIVSSLSKAKLAEQNHNKFKEYLSHGYVKNIKPYLISSESSGENALYISPNENVYSLPRDLYKKNSKLKDQQAFLRFIKQVKAESKTIILIKDECHIATKNLDEIDDSFELVLNVSATPKTVPDVQITDFEAVEANLIKTVRYRSELTSDSFDIDSPQYSELREALYDFIDIKKIYLSKFNINPCFIIQISNTQQGQKQYESVLNLLNENDFKDLKYISTAQDPKLCSTNDQLIKTSPSKWEKYVTRNDSLIDIIIFKMVISEGWDIPRACMLFQIRDSKSKQLDEQVLGRIRRNPLILDFENLPESDRTFITTGYVWGLKDKNSRAVPVTLKGDIPFEIGQIKNQIQSEIRILTTRLKDLTSVQSGFDIDKYLNSVKPPLANKNIFSLYKDLQNASNDIQKACGKYCSKQSDYFQAWFKFNNNLKDIQSRSKAILSDYGSSIEIIKDSNGKQIESTLPFESLYIKNEKFSYQINDWVWDNKTEFSEFTFDSEAEKRWVHRMLKDFNIKTINIDGCDIKLVGKNFLVNSSIKYQYYRNGIHDSYPDFILKDSKNRYFLFEVKSLNQSSGNINNIDYTEKIQDLQMLYLSVSKLLDYYFCIPIAIGTDFNIHVYHKGMHSELNFAQLKLLINQ